MPEDKLLIARPCTVSTSKAPHKIIEELVASDRRLTFLPESHSWSSLRAGRIPDDFGFHSAFLHTRRPAWTVAENCPYILDESTTSKWAGGSCCFDSLHDPALGELWHHISEIRPVHHTLFIDVWNITENIFSVDCRNKFDGTCKLEFLYRHSDTTPMFIDRFTELLGFDSTPFEDNTEYSNFVRTYDKAPFNDFLPSVCSAVQAFSSYSDFEAGDVTIRMYVAGAIRFPFENTPYDDQRPGLNAISGNWITTFPAFYADDVDVYARPKQIPADVGEVRYNVVSLENAFGDTPDLHVDVVHKPNETYVEFATIKKPQTLKKYAKAAGVKLEFWEGPLQERWDG